MQIVGNTNRLWHGSAAIFIVAATFLLATFLALRPLRLESPASGSARALLRLDNALGATVEPVDQSTAGLLGLQSSGGDLVVTSLANKGPAVDAGIRVGDVIERIDGRAAVEADAASIGQARTTVLINRRGSHAIVNVQFTGASRA